MTVLKLSTSTPQSIHQSNREGIHSSPLLHFSFPSIEPWTVIAKTRGPALNSTKFPTERKEKNSIILPIDARKVRLSTKEKEIFPMAEA